MEAVNGLLDLRTGKSVEQSVSSATTVPLSSRTNRISCTATRTAPPTTELKPEYKLPLDVTLTDSEYGMMLERVWTMFNIVRWWADEPRTMHPRFLLWRNTVLADVVMGIPDLNTNNRPRKKRDRDDHARHHDTYDIQDAKRRLQLTTCRA